jgi:hypothetical protein
MKRVFLFLAILFFVSTIEVFSQTSIQPKTRRNCSYVGRPIIDIAGGFVIGKALKLPKPRLSKNAKKLAQNTLITVKIKVDENGKVIFAKAEEGNPLLQNLSEQAALKSEFASTTSSGQRVTVEMEITYQFKKSKVEINVIPIMESIEDKSEPIDPNTYILARMFDLEILGLIKKSRSETVMNFGDFVSNGQANIQICLGEKTPEIVKRIKEKGFELLEESQGNGLVGKISVENLEKLVDIEEIKRIVPEFQ